MNVSIINSNPHFERLGGEEGVRKLVDRFYDLMHEDPGDYGIRKLHPKDLTKSRNKFYWSLCEWTGGPNPYNEGFGHPFLRQRHMPFAIGTSERDQWMACMKQAMLDAGLPGDLRGQLSGAFFKTADFLRNQPG